MDLNTDVEGDPRGGTGAKRPQEACPDRLLQVPDRGF